MADLEDVMTAVSAASAVAVYPNGLDSPSVAGIPVLVVQGWPDSSGLNADLKAGKAQVSVFPLDMERNTTRFQRVWQPVSIAKPTITLTAVDDVITVGGAMPSPFALHNLAALIQGKAYLYSVQATDTLTSITTALAALIAVDFPLTTVSGETILVGGVTVVGRDGTPITCRVGTIGTSVREVRRQKRLFQITIWAPTPDSRRKLLAAMDAALQKTAFITMPDGLDARVEYFDSPMTDGIEKSQLYRRDLRYFIEYATTETVDAATVVVGRVTSTDSNDNDSTTDY
jgi:hypothetical protein